MTIGLGIRCSNGLVLCADSRESDGVTKRNVAKIREIFSNGEWGIAVVTAGEADYAENFTDDLSETLCDKGEFDEAWFSTTLRRAVRDTRSAYPKGELALLFGVYHKTKEKTVSRILRVMDGSSHPGPVRDWQAIGIGSYLSDFFLENLYTPSIEVDEGIKLAVFAIAQAKEYVDGCGGPTIGWQWKLSDSQWHPRKCREIERVFSVDDLKRVLGTYWNALA